jgi:hypothetical protein
MVSGPLHETTPGRPATAIRIPVVLCGASGVKTKILSTKKKGPGCKHRSRSHGESGEVFLLDILSHRMSVIDDMTISIPSFSKLLGWMVTLENFRKNG